MTRLVSVGPSSVRAILVVLAILAAGVGIASAEDGRSCSNALVAGDWGYLKTGTLTLPTGPAAFAAVGRITLSPDGLLSGTQDNNIGGMVGKGELRGSYILQADCTASMTVDVLDATSGALLRTVLMSVVFEDKATELRGIVTKILLPNGASLPQVITGSARRIFPGHDGE